MGSMKQVILSWNDMPELAPSVKQIIELSVWTMFQVDSEMENAKYLLDTADSRFFLASSGAILKMVENTDVYEIHERVFFESLVMTAEL